MNSRRHVFLVAAVFALALGGLAGIAGAASKKTTDDSVVAQIGDHKITMQQVDDAAAAQNMQAFQALYDARRQALEDLINQELLQLEAKARGVTKEQFIQSEVTQKLQPVTDADVEKYYNENNARMRGQPLDKMAPEIKKFLDAQAGAATQSALFDSLRKKHQVSVALEPPRTTVNVATEDPRKGPDGAVIQIVEFSDFQCPYCSKMGPTLDKLMETYGSKVQIVFRDYPLSFHQQAQKAAEAAQCANAQNKFWEYHDKLFANQQALMPESLKSYAVEIGLDGEKFNTCLDSGQFTSEVTTDFQEGSSFGVRGTPAFFINGRFLSGAQPYEAFAKIVEEELQLKGGSNKS